MRNIRNYKAEKYLSPLYTEVSPGIYSCEKGFVTSLCFDQEPELDEGSSAADISQYPLEDVLDRFGVYVSDFFDALNVSQSQTCYLEFCGNTADDILQLRSVIGRHVYNKESGGSADLIVE